MSRPHLTLALAALAILATGAFGGCDDDAIRAKPGLDARLRVTGAQFIAASPPTDQGGPTVQSVNLLSTAVGPGVEGRVLSGALDPRASAAIVYLAGDPGYWVLPAGPPDVNSPGLPAYRAELAFGQDLPSGPTDLIVQASDADGRFGPLRVTTLTSTGALVPTGALVVSLAWQGAADLDLHLVDPSGIEIFNRNPSSAPIPFPRPPDFQPDGGLLDTDSNAQCVPDGKRRENVVYANRPPPGHYLARVDTSSLCGDPSAYWTLEAFLDGVRLGGAAGTATAADARFPHDRGAGVLALQFDVP